METKKVNITWRFLLFVVVLNLQNCLASSNVEVLNDDSLDKLNNIYNKWLTYLSKVPDATWMIHNSANPKLNWYKHPEHHHGISYDIPTMIDDIFSDPLPTGNFNDKMEKIFQKLDKIRKHVLSEFNSSGIDISDIDDGFPTLIPHETKEIISTHRIVSKFSYRPTVPTFSHRPTVPRFSHRPTVPSIMSTLSVSTNDFDETRKRHSTYRTIPSFSHRPTVPNILSTPPISPDDVNRTVDALVNLIDNIINDLAKLNFTKFENDLSKLNLSNIEDILLKLNLTFIDDIITKLNDSVIDDILEGLNSTIIANILLEINSTLSQIDVKTIQDLLNKFNFEEFLEQELIKRSKFINNRCNYDLLYLMTKFKKPWAKEMLDAAGKLPSGLLKGNIHWMGDFNQCRNISVPKQTIKKYQFGNFKGEYCYVSWNIELPQMNLPLYLGVCVPDSCSSGNLLNDTKEISQFINYIPVVQKVNKYANVTKITCQSNEKEWKPGHVIYMCILSIFAFFILVGTLCDILKSHVKEIKIDLENGNTEIKNNVISDESLSKSAAENVMALRKESAISDTEPLSIQQQYPEHQESFLIQFLICFSVYTNGAKIFNIGNGSGQLDCLHGIRFLSMGWIILGHTYFYALTLMIVENLQDVLEYADTFSFQAISQATYSVDTFFLLSGFLLSYLFLKDRFENQKNMNWIYYYIHRLWRLTPAFAMMLGFYATVWIHLGNGPSWPYETDDGNCRKYWWWNILYLLNFVDVKDMCMGWTWYLANDMQFYIISPIFLFLLWKFSTLGIIVVGIVMLISWIITGVLSIEYDLVSVLTFSQNLQLSQIEKLRNIQYEFFNVIYDKPYCRIGPYLVGILVGYALYVAKQHHKFMKTIILVLGWIFALFFGLSVIFGLYHADIGLSTGSVYNALSRTTWGIAVAWVIFVCLTGYGGPVNSILSWKVWIPLSRLTYCAYLVHPMIIQWYYNALLKPLYFDTNTMVLYYFGFLLFSYLLAFVASMAFESPMMALEKLLLKRLKKNRNS